MGPRDSYFFPIQILHLSGILNEFLFEKNKYYLTAARTNSPLIRLVSQRTSHIPTIIKMKIFVLIDNNMCVKAIGIWFHQKLLKVVCR